MKFICNVEIAYSCTEEQNVKLGLFGFIYSSAESLKLNAF